MTVREVPAAQWPEFLDRFSRQHAAWMCCLHGIVAGAPFTRVRSLALRLVGIESGTLDRSIQVTFMNGMSLSASRPRVVRVQQENGAERALEVETADGALLRLSFRATALPEQLDGMTAGELVDDKGVKNAAGA